MKALYPGNCGPICPRCGGTAGYAVLDAAGYLSHPCPELTRTVEPIDADPEELHRWLMQEDADGYPEPEPVRAFGLLTWLGMICAAWVVLGVLVWLAGEALALIMAGQ